jgi:hypothetical protein
MLSAPRAKLLMNTKLRIAKEKFCWYGIETSAQGMRLHRRYESFLDEAIDWVEVQEKNPSRSAFSGTKKDTHTTV